ncbi:hypothetical protein [Flavobacterium sp. XGLA_31]|uniref:hypothetical protein n=1 Tax=Flavobacterium sp. XGLA_31 TaxID=3447666 RepID=UPI003F383DDE
MKHIIKTILFLIAFVFLGCEKKITAEEFEQGVFDALLVKIVDSTYTDQRLYTCFPEQGKPMYDKKGRWIGLDTVGQHQRDLECEVKRAALEKDTLNLIIALENKGMITEQTDLSKYKSPKFIFRHLSEHPRGKDLEYTEWKTEKKFAGVMSFSRIRFDTKKESGSLDVGYRCGGKCGLGYTVYIKKIKGEWVIVKVEETWIS